MSKLRHVPPIHHDEALTSFVSRLAGRYRLDARTFCLDMGLQFQQIVNGVQSAIEQLAGLTGIAVGTLAAGAFRLIGEKRHEFRGHLFPRSYLRRDAVRVCGACLQQDISASELRPEIAAYGRAAWQIGAIRTCPVHQRALVEIHRRATSSTLHDFRIHVEKILPRLAGAAMDAPPRPPSTLESYVAARFAHADVDAGWLNNWPLHAVIKGSEMTGALELFGRRFEIRNFSDEDFWRCGDHGFLRLTQGELAVRALLSDVRMSPSAKRAAQEGPKAFFGSFWNWLAHNPQDPAFDHLRGVVENYLRSTTPMGPDDELFGRKGAPRQLHSVWTAAEEIKFVPARLRKILVANGVIPCAQARGLTHHHVTFDANNASDLLRKLKDALTLNEAAKYINANRSQTRALVDSCDIKPLVKADKELIYLFAREDLDEFITRLTWRADPVGTAVLPIADIAIATRRCCCSAPEIVRLISEGSIWTGRLADVSGYGSVVVNIDEVRIHVQGPALQDLTLRQVEKALHSSSGTVRALVDTGDLPSRTVLNPVNRCPVRVVPHDALEKFKSTYVSLQTLAKERKTHFLQLKSYLDARGVPRALSYAPTTFYRRADLPPA